MYELVQQTQQMFHFHIIFKFSLEFFYWKKKLFVIFIFLQCI